MGTIGPIEKSDTQSDKKEDLDLVLRKEGLLSSSAEPVKPYTKDFMLELRRSREFEKQYLHGKGDNVKGFASIESQIEGISDSNKRIENQLKYEIMGIQDSPISKIAYRVHRLYHEKLKGRPFQTADSLIRDQIGRVGNIISDLSGANRRVESKMDNVEERYNGILLSLINKDKDRDETLQRVNKIAELMAKTQEAVKGSEDYQKRLYYMQAHRKLKRQLDEGLSRLKIDNRAMLLLHDELPLIEALSAISFAYSTSLKETEQEARYLASHLDTVLGLYLEMIRPKRGPIKDLERETRKLGIYVVNMSNSLRGCAAEVVEKANQSSLFSGFYKQGELTLDSVLRDIEDSNSSAFREIEGRMSKYLNP